MNVEHRTSNIEHRMMYSACRESFVERSILKRLSDVWDRSSTCWVAAESEAQRAKPQAWSDSTIRQSSFDIRHFMQYSNTPILLGPNLSKASCNLKIHYLFVISPLFL